MSTEYELRAKNRKEGAGKELIMNELDAKMQLAARALLIDGTNPQLWIAHDRGNRNIFKSTTSIYIEHMQIGLCIPFEIHDEAAQFAKLPADVPDCKGAAAGCEACLALEKTDWPDWD